MTNTNDCKFGPVANRTLVLRSFEGSINENQEGGTVAVSLDDSSTWTLTGDSYVTSFEGSMDNVNLNGYTFQRGGYTAIWMFIKNNLLDY